MSEMVRKQIYIKKRQDAMLKRLSKARGLSEAEIIRQAIERELGGRQTLLNSDPQAWEKAHQYMASLHELGPIEGQTRSWKREDLYEERLSRYDRHSD